MASCDEITSCIPIECEDACGFPGVVVYDNETFPILSQRDAIERIAFDDGHITYSSVRPFQSAQYEYEDPATLDSYPVETTSNSPASLQEEEDEGEEHLQPSDTSDHINLQSAS